MPCFSLTHSLRWETRHANIRLKATWLCGLHFRLPRWNCSASDCLFFQSTFLSACWPLEVAFRARRSQRRRFLFVSVRWAVWSPSRVSSYTWGPPAGIRFQPEARLKWHRWSSWATQTRWVNHSNLLSATSRLGSVLLKTRWASASLCCAAGQPEDEGASVLHQARSSLPRHHPGGLLPRNGPLMAGGAARWLSHSSSAAPAADTLLSDLVVRQRGKTQPHTHCDSWLTVPWQFDAVTV